MKKNDLTKFLILGVLTLIVYAPTFIWMVERWSAAATYYSHGFLVPFISIFIIWNKRKELSKIKAHPLKMGWLFFISGLLIHFLSLLWQVSFTSALSMLLVIAGLTLLFLGKHYLKQLIFPISFLLFMIPMPEVLIANLSFRLKLFAAQVSTTIVNWMGVTAIRDGSVIKTAHSYLMVEDPCSGIRSLIAMVALGALMAYFSEISKKKKVVLFLSSIPIAASSNVIRIVSLSLVSEIYGQKYATGIFHDTMGILVFVFISFFKNLELYFGEQFKGP